MSERGWDGRLRTSSAQALYLHVPFCARKCAYCDFASWETQAQDPLMAAYAHALSVQIDEAEGLGLLQEADTAYVGGGTPSLLGEDLLPLVSRVAALGASEIT